GAAYARHFAIAGYHLVLVARDRSRLQESRPMLLAAGAPHVQTIEADLTVPDQRADVVARLQDDRHPVNLLVNNAGMGLGKDFVTATPDELIAQQELNVTAVMLLAHAAIPGMKRRRYGGIVNIASVAGMVPGRGS